MERRAWFTSDTHFGHTNIVQYCQRPFTDVHHMNRELVRRWNKVVEPLDIVYHLGDFAMGNRGDIPGHLNKLNGKITLVRGNHDRSQTAMREAGFTEIYDELVVEVEGTKVYLHHQPVDDMRKWKGAQIHLHGHVHTEYQRRGRLINVGVDMWDFTPRSISELLAAADV